MNYRALQYNIDKMVEWPNDAGLDTTYQEHDPVELTVKGEIPQYAAGVLYRTGPLGYKAETADGKVWAAQHWYILFSRSNVRSSMKLT